MNKELLYLRASVRETVDSSDRFNEISFARQQNVLVSSAHRGRIQHQKEPFGQYEFNAKYYLTFTETQPLIKPV